MFRAGQVSPAKELITRDLPAERELSLLADHGHPWGMIDLADLGVNPVTALLHRTAARIPAGTNTAARGNVEIGPRNLNLCVSDTRQITWDRRKKGNGVVTINSPRTQAVIGFTAGRSFELGGVTITPGKTRQDWCTIALSLVEGESFTRPCRALLVATGSAENTGMHWKNAEHSSVGRQWGGPPSLVEAIPATIRLPMSPDRLRAWSLDEHGQRSGQLKIQPGSSGGSVIEIGGGPTLWYELVAK